MKAKYNYVFGLAAPVKFNLFGDDGARIVSAFKSPTLILPTN